MFQISRAVITRNQPPSNAVRDRLPPNVALLGLVSLLTAMSSAMVYGLLPLFVSFLAELIRAGAAQQELGALDFQSLAPERQQVVAMAIVRREMGIMAVACLVILFLALRAAGTSTAF